MPNYLAKLNATLDASPSNRSERWVQVNEGKWQLTAKDESGSSEMVVLRGDREWILISRELDTAGSIITACGWSYSSFKKLAAESFQTA
jgi:hypothetical protein